jgi:hypothetical protein
MYKIQRSIEKEDEFGGIFSLSQEDVVIENSNKGGGSSLDPDYYRPSTKHKKAQGKRYVATGRWCPNVNDRTLQYVSKYIYALPDPTSTNPDIRHYYDCTSNEGIKNNIITNSFFTLKDHDSATKRKIAEDYLTRKEYYWSLFLIYKDIQDPELEGMVKILRYAKGIKEKMNQQSMGNPELGTKPCIYTDPFGGKDFQLVIEEKEDGNGKIITSYDKSYFGEERNTISLDKGVTRLDKSEENMRTVFNFLKEKSPDLGKAKYKKWSPEDEEKIIETIKYLVEDNVLFDKIYRKTYNKPFFNAEIPKEEKSGISDLANKVSGKEDKKEDKTVKGESKAETTAKQPEKSEEKQEVISDLTKIKINFDEVD